MASVTINGTRLEYNDTGSGAPVVFVHGSASDCRTWQHNFEDLAGKFRRIVYSRRYHWPNEPIPEGTDYSMAQHVDDLKALLQSLEAVPAHLVGHSYGAFLCLLLAIKEPYLIRRLVLIEPPVITLFVSNTPKPQEILKLLMTRPRTAAAIIKFGVKGAEAASKAFKRGDLEGGVRKLAGAVFGQEDLDRYSELRLKQVNDNISNIKEELLGSGFLPLDVGQVRNVKAPTLLVNGQNSVTLFNLLNDRLEQLLPHVERIEIPEATHAVQEDNPAAFNAVIQSFLTKQ